MSSLAAYASYFEPDTRYNARASADEDATAHTDRKEERDVKDVIRMLHTNYAEEATPSLAARAPAVEPAVAPAVAPAPAPAAAPIEKYEAALEGFAQPEHEFAPLWPDELEARAGAGAGSTAGARDVRRLLNKMDHILHLIEDSNTGTNVTEELILYCFLGIFVIFLVDSFLHAGKTYHR